MSAQVASDTQSIQQGTGNLRLGLTVDPSRGGQVPLTTEPANRLANKPTDWAEIVKGPTLDLVVASKARHGALRTTTAHPIGEQL